MGWSSSILQPATTSPAPYSTNSLQSPSLLQPTKSSWGGLLVSTGQHSLLEQCLVLELVLLL